MLGLPMNASLEAAQEQQRLEELEEQRQERAQRRLALALADSSDRWADTLRSATPHMLSTCLLVAVVLSLMNAEFVGLLGILLWMGVIFKTNFKPSCCRTTGGVAIALSVVAMLMTPGPGVLATPFFELPLCRNTSGGALYGLHGAGAGLTSAVTCAHTEAGPVDVPLTRDTLDADRAYRPVVLLPAGSHASLVLTVLDATGAQLYLPTKLELGPGESFPWDRALAPATAAIATPLPTIPTASSSVFAASTRRRLLSVGEAADPLVAAAEGRRLRGFGMRMGGGLGGGRFGSFTRGTGAFGSPHRGISQGPGRRGIGATSAMGGGGRAGAVGRPGATYFHNTPYAGGGYHPSMGYHPSLGFDIATGMMIGHMLHQPRRRHSAGSLHGGQQPQQQQQLLLPAPPYRLGSYYYAPNAIGRGSVLSVAALAAAGVPTAAAGFKTLVSSYDRNAVVEELRTPAAPLWPLRLRLTEVAVTPNVTTAEAPPAVLLGLQAAGPPQLRSTILRRRLATFLNWASSLSLVLLALVAFAGIRRQQFEQSDDAASDGSLSELEMGPVPLPPADVALAARGSRNVVPRRVAGAPFISADGEIVAVGSRVQTQHTAEYGGDGAWYAGTILTLHDDHRATIIYDDGEEWTARLDEVYVLQGDAQDEGMEDEHEESARAAGGGQDQGLRRPTLVPLADQAGGAPDEAPDRSR